MNLNKDAVGMDVRIIIAVLWVAEVLSSLNGDTYRLSNPVDLKALLANNGPIVATPELFLVMSIIFVVPIFLSVLTLTLNNHVSRWVNRITSIVYTLLTLGFLVLNFVLEVYGYQILWAAAQVAFTLPVVWYAWKWQKPLSNFKD